jgi:hypothetical protein
MLGSVDLSSVEVTMPRVGAWHARGVAHEPVVVGANVLTIEGVTFRGYVQALPAELLPTGGYAFRMVGGAGGLGAIAPRYYRAPSASLVLQDIASDTGETLSTSGGLSYQLAAFARPEGLATAALLELLRHAPAGTVWRILDDGTLWTGVDAYADSGISTEQILEQDTACGMLEVATDTPTLRPGMMLAGERVSAVVHRSGDRSLRTEAWVARAEEGAEETERFAWAFDELARRAVPTVHLRAYRCVVLGQNADGTLELQPISPRAKVGKLSSVPIRHGFPGLVVTVQAGAYVHAVFADGEASGAFAALWDTTPGLVRVAFDGGTQPIARIGDIVATGALSGTVVVDGSPVSVQFTWQPPPALPGGTLPPPVGPGPTVDLNGRVATGKATFHA